MTSRRRVAKFADKAREILTAPTPAGVSVNVDDGRAWFFGPAGARCWVVLDPYDLGSADPARVYPEAVSKLERQAQDPRYTEKSQAADAALAVMLSGVTL